MMRHALRAAAFGFLVAALMGSARAQSGEGSDVARFVLTPAVSDGPLAVSLDFSSAAIQGWAFALCHEPGTARVARFGGSPDLLSIRGGYPPDFYVCELGSSVSNEGIIQAAVLSYTDVMTLPAREGGFPVLEVEYQVLAESSVGICDDLQGRGQPVKTTLTINGQTYRPQFAAGSLIQKPFAGKLKYTVEPPESSEVVTVKLFSEDVRVEGWSFALCHDAAGADLFEMATSPELERLIDGEPPAYVLNDIAQAGPFIAARQAVILSGDSVPTALGPFTDGLPLLGLRYRVASEDVLKFCDRIGDVSFDNRVTIDGIGYVPATRLGAKLVTGALGTRFIRGDADLDGRVNMTDAIVVLMALFLGGRPLECLDAADANDVGRVDISDPIFLLRYLFTGGPEPPSPFPDPGEELSPATALGCERGL